MEATLENKCTVSVSVFKAAIMQGAEKMYYQPLLSSPTSKQQEERIHGTDSQADC